MPKLNFVFISLTLLAFSVGSCLYGQSNQPNLDSLYEVWNDETLNDSIRIGALQKYTWFGFLYDDSDSAYALAEKSFLMAQEANLISFMGWARLGQGVTFEMRGFNTLAIEYYLKGVEYFEQVDDKAGIAGALNNIGMMYYELGDLDHAEQYYSKSLEYRLEVGDRKGTAGSYENLGIIEQDRGNYAKAFEYQKKSLEIMASVGHKSGIAASYAYMGKLHMNMGELDSAHYYYSRCLEIDKEVGKIKPIANHLIDMGFLII